MKLYFVKGKESNFCPRTDCFQMEKIRDKPTWIPKVMKDCGKDSCCQGKYNSVSLPSSTVSDSQ